MTDSPFTDPKLEEVGKALDPPFKRRSRSRRARRSEEQGAAKEGGRRVAMSGAGRQKGDIRGTYFRTEDKFTDAASFVLKLATWLKIEREAHLTPPCLMPKMRITIGSGKDKRTLWVLLEDDGLALEESHRVCEYLKRDAVKGVSLKPLPTKPRPSDYRDIPSDYRDIP